jgi:2'-5' RNA ligase
MITAYASTVEHWEKWQREYRFGVLLLFPPEPVRAQVNALRAAHDPISQATCDAHISLTVPLPRPLTEEDWRALQVSVTDLAPFRVHYGPLRHYLPYPGVCLAIEPQEVLDALRRRLEAAPFFAGTLPRSHPFSAHMTIAEFISVEQTETLMDELAGIASSGGFTCSGVSYAVPDAAFHFTERRELRLGRTNGST